MEKTNTNQVTEEEVKKKKPCVPVPFGANKEIAKLFGCSAQAVSYALHYLSNSEQAVQIREYAINKWGSKALVLKKRSRTRKK